MAAVMAAASACDKDTTAPAVNFRRLDCPSGRLGINAPIAIGFSGRVATATIAPGNVVISNALTGVEIPGSLSSNAARGGDTIFFAPATALPFDTPVRIRVQNIQPAAGGVGLQLAVCDVQTALADITRIPWTQLAQVPGNLFGASLLGTDSGVVVAREGPFFRTNGSNFAVLFDSPYTDISFDAAMVSAQRGFLSALDGHRGRGIMFETRNGGATADTLFTSNPIWRVFAFPIAGNIFAVAGGGDPFEVTTFYKYQAASDNFTTQTITTPHTLSSAGYITDIDFVAPDTTIGAAVSVGVQVGTFGSIGRLWISRNGGASWDSVPGSQASNQTLTYQGVALRQHGQQVFVAGGNGTLRRFTLTGTATYTPSDYPLSAFAGLRLPGTGIATDLIFNDVEFNPANDQQGWLVGAQLVGFINGVPQYQGLIFETNDGGTTWTREGVRGFPPTFGALIPPLHRIVIGPGAAGAAPSVWIVGDAGTVLTYHP